MDRPAQLELLALETQAKDLETQVAEQLQQLEDARRALSRTNARIRALKNYYTPIHSLPNELLLYIVKLTQQSSWTPIFGREDILMEITMSHVSSRWRETVISAPTLWTHIGSASMPWTTELLDMYLRRSQPCTVSIVLAPDKSFESDKDRLAQLVSHVDRFENLALYGDCAYSYSQVLHSLRAPKLKALHIHCTGTYYSHKISPFTEGAPLLSFLYLNNCFFDHSSSIISSVTHFYQGFTTTSNLTPWPFRLTISQMTWLTELVVCVDDLREVGPYDILSLRSFALDFLEFEETHVPLDVFPISSPYLESLVMMDCHGDQIMSVFNRLGAGRSQRLYPKMQSLVLWDRSSYDSCTCNASDIPPPNIADAIQTFPSISHISFINVCHQGLILRMLLRDAVELIQPTSRAALPWTNLHSVTVLPIHTVSCREIFKFRKDCGYPISKLRVTKNGFDYLSRMSLEERAEVPEVEIFDKEEFIGSLIWYQ